MAVEIKELVIRAIVSDNESSDNGSTPAVSEVNKEALVQECVDQVLKVLKNKNRR
ncbi:MAG: DUF5908 family protein [Crocinitomicaceae bacterium]